MTRGVPAVLGGGHPAYGPGLIVLCVIASFVIGSVNPAAIIARLLERDLRGSGSGNPGATNAGRVLGARWGVVVGVLDVLKGFLPTLLLTPRTSGPLVGVCAVAAVAGHIWSPFLRGRGGKGVATTLGALLAMAPWFALVALVAFAAGIAAWRTTGKASILASAVLVVAGALVAATDAWPSMRWAACWTSLLGLMVLARHHRNLRAWGRLARR